LKHTITIALAAGLALSSSGCIVGSVYAYKANSAASALEQAKTLGADHLAEYEYFFARENLQKAMEEAAEASYGDAITFADIAKEYADKAIEKSGAAHRGAGR
jgi:hypothetical protein